MKKFAVILLTICLMSVMLCACTADSGGMDADAETPEPNNDFYDWGMDHISMKDIFTGRVLGSAAVPSGIFLHLRRGLHSVNSALRRL